jgi:formylglycine-generating enzyme
MDDLRQSYGLDGDAKEFFELAQQLEAKNDLHRAATAYDRAFGLAPEREDIAQARIRLLNQLSVIEHGMIFRYIPAGSFLMGSDTGDPDEQPVHPVELDAYWIAEIPLHWGLFNVQSLLFRHPSDAFESPTKENQPLFDDEYFAVLELGYKFAILSINWNAAVNFCALASTEAVVYRLPTEAEWEKAARGGLINKKYPWGDEPPIETRCDFNHFGEYSVRPINHYSPNHYGLRAMSGSIWEWVSDWYDAEYYHNSPRLNPNGPEEGVEHVIRGGSWADSEESLTVSFRASRRNRPHPPSPNIGFRLCRVFHS